MKSPELRNKKLLPLLALAAAGGVALDGKLSSNHHPKSAEAPLSLTKLKSGDSTYTTIVSESSPKSPNVSVYPVEYTLDGDNTLIGAAVEPSKRSYHIDSARISLTHPKEVPTGVSIGKSELVNNRQGEEVVAQFNDPSNPNLPSGEVEVNVTATESNGATTTVQEEIPYSPQPTRPS